MTDKAVMVGDVVAEMSAIKSMLLSVDGLRGGEFVCNIWLLSPEYFSLHPQIHIHTESGRGADERGIEVAAQKLHDGGWRSDMPMADALKIVQSRI